MWVTRNSLKPLQTIFFIHKPNFKCFNMAMSSLRELLSFQDIQPLFLLIQVVSFIPGIQLVLRLMIFSFSGVHLPWYMFVNLMLRRWVKSKMCLMRFWMSLSSIGGYTSFFFSFFFFLSHLSSFINSGFTFLTSVACN